MASYHAHQAFKGSTEEEFCAAVQEVASVGPTVSGGHDPTIKAAMVKIRAIMGDKTLSFSRFACRLDGVLFLKTSSGSTFMSQRVGSGPCDLLLMSGSNMVLHALTKVRAYLSRHVPPFLAESWFMRVRIRTLLGDVGTVLLNSSFQ